jgi:hypothetical protein
MILNINIYTWDEVLSAGMAGDADNIREAAGFGAGG